MRQQDHRALGLNLIPCCQISVSTLPPQKKSEAEANPSILIQGYQNCDESVGSVWYPFTQNKAYLFITMLQFQSHLALS